VDCFPAGEDFVAEFVGVEGFCGEGGYAGGNVGVGWGNPCFAFYGDTGFDFCGETSVMDWLEGIFHDD
jgi:hypothetical protein